MKKTILILTLIFAFILSACGNTTKDENKQPTVFTTVYPITYFTQQIAGNTLNVQSIYPTGANEHSFEPTQKDMLALANADLFFYIGLGLEGFVNKAEKTLDSESVQFVSLTNSMDESLFLEVSEHSHEEENNAHDNEEIDHNIDPHIWLSPTISKDLVNTIHKQLIEKYPENKSLYDENVKALQDKLSKLDSDFSNMAQNADNKIFFVSHAAFGYIAHDYGLEQVAIAGLNSQDEPSQKELAHIVEDAKQHNISVVFFEQNVSSNLTKVIQESIGASASTLHNLSVLTDEDVKNKEDYFTLMNQNLKNLSAALTNK